MLSFRNISFLFRFHISLALLAVLSIPFGVSCSGTPTPSLGHMKRPTAMATAIVSRKNEDQYLMFLTSADLDQLSIVNIPGRGFVIDEDLRSPGILYIPTGRYPIDIATTSDQKYIIVLHGIDGDLGILDTRKILDPKGRSDAKTVRFPENCKKKETCWKNPQRLALIQTSQKRIAFVALAGESAVVAIDLSNPLKGKQLKRFRVDGTPTDLLKSKDGKKLYVTNSQTEFVHVIDTEKLTIERVSVGTRTNGGAVSLDGNWLYLLDGQNGGIRIYDIKKKKVVSPGETRFPKRKNLLVKSAAFLSVLFLDKNSVGVKDKFGKTKYIEGLYAWATATDGYTYLIDTAKHQFLDENQKEASASSAKVFVEGSSRETTGGAIRKTLPSIVRADKSSNGIEVFDGKTRSELWTLVYEGVVFSGKIGSFVDWKKGVFLNAENLNLEKMGALKGDLLILEKACEGTNSSKIDCFYPILEVKEGRLIVDVAKQKQPKAASFSFSIRASKKYIVRGLVTGLLSQRAEEGKAFRSDYFGLLLQKGSEKTKRDFRIEFSTNDGFSVKRIKLGGFPLRSLVIPDHLACTQKDCNSLRCKGHINCSSTKCVPGTGDVQKQCLLYESCHPKTFVCEPTHKFWALDTAEDRVFIVNASEELLLEKVIR